MPVYISTFPGVKSRLRRSPVEAQCITSLRRRPARKPGSGSAPGASDDSNDTDVLVYAARKPGSGSAPGASDDSNDTDVLVYAARKPGSGSAPGMAAWDGCMGWPWDGMLGMAAICTGDRGMDVIYTGTYIHPCIVIYICIYLLLQYIFCSVAPTDVPPVP